jgi:LacI family transcriptional regulator
VTLEDVARHAGVSKATASVALRSGNGVAADTCTRVAMSAATLGYRSSALRRRSQVPVKIGAVLGSAPDPSGESQYYGLELLAGAREELGGLGEAELQVVAKEEVGAAASGLSGLLFLGGAFDARLLDQPLALSVLVGTYFPQWPFDAVLADNSRGAYLAVKNLFSSGRSTIALLNGPATTRTSELKELGYREALADCGCLGSIVEAGDFSPEDGYRLAQQVLEANPDVDGLVVADDPMAVGALHGLADAGHRVPEDVAVIGFGDSPAALLSRPSLSSVRVFQRQMGAIGARMLAERLAGRQGPYIRTLLSPELVLRESSGASAQGAPAQPPLLAAAKIGNNKER